MRHHSCCDKQKVKRGLWSPEEDEKLVDYVMNHGHGCWSSVPKRAGLQRCGRSCRLRWMNYLRPDLKRGSFSSEESAIIIELHRILGSRWAQIARHLPGRTDNEVKNFWNSSFKKKLASRDFHYRALSNFPGHHSYPMRHENPNLVEDEGSFFTLPANPNIMLSNPPLYQDHQLYFPQTTPLQPITWDILHRNSHFELPNQPNFGIDPFLSPDMPVIRFREQLIPHQMDPNCPVQNFEFERIGILNLSSEIIAPANVFPVDAATMLTPHEIPSDSNLSYSIPTNSYSTSLQTGLCHNEDALITKTRTDQGFIPGDAMPQFSTCGFTYSIIPNMVTTVAPLWLEPDAVPGLESK